MTNWPTEEMSRWLMNDEGLYELARETLRHSTVLTRANDLLEIVEGIGFDVLLPHDFKKVDWDEVAVDLSEESWWKCDICDGDGKLEEDCKYCEGDGCDLCEETGKVSETCWQCEGTGVN